MYYLETNRKDYEVDNLKDLYKKADELSELNVDFKVFEDCNECQGQVTYYSIVNYCSRPVSDCCGGCNELIHCEECDNGKIEFTL